ncbi:hypothetical protein D9M70_636350 [compost metagenome]
MYSSAVTVSTETQVVTSTLADARSTHTLYCWAMTNTLVAVGRAASSIAENSHTGEKLPIQLSTT